jgi:hypothetical protein
VQQKNVRKGINQRSKKKKKKKKKWIKHFHLPDEPNRWVFVFSLKNALLYMD